MRRSRAAIRSPVGGRPQPRALRLDGRVCLPSDPRHEAARSSDVIHHLRRPRRERERARGPRRTRRHLPLSGPGPRAARGLRRPRRARQLAHRLGQDAGLRPSADRAPRARGIATLGADPRPHPRARLADRDGAGPPRGRSPAADRGLLRRRRTRGSGQACVARRHHRGDARSPHRPHAPEEGRPGRRGNPRARRSRSHARHGLPAAGEGHRRTAAPRAPHHVLLGHPRRPDRGARRAVHPRRRRGCTPSRARTTPARRSRSGSHRASSPARRPRAPRSCSI